MSERVSKLILGIEALLLAVPVTFLFLIWFPDELYRSAEYGGFVNRISAALAGSTLVAGWWLMAIFWHRGSTGLRETYAVAWVVAGCGSVATLLVGAVLWLLPQKEFRQQFGVLAFGLPLLIPFLHLLIERMRREDANKPLQRTRSKQRASER